MNETNQLGAQARKRKMARDVNFAKRGGRAGIVQRAAPLPEGIWLNVSNKSEAKKVSGSRLGKKKGAKRGDWPR